jgi:hypothetical protein
MIGLKIFQEILELMVWCGLWCLTPLSTVLLEGETGEDNRPVVRLSN